MICSSISAQKSNARTFYIPRLQNVMELAVQQNQILAKNRTFGEKFNFLAKNHIFDQNPFWQLCPGPESKNSFESPMTAIGASSSGETSIRRCSCFVFKFNNL